MKKVLALFMVIVLSVSIFSSPTFALSSDESSDERVDVRDELLNDEIFFEVIQHSADEIDIEYCYKIAQNKYLLRYRVVGQEYSDEVNKEYADRYKEWMLYSTDPEPCVYIRRGFVMNSHCAPLSRSLGYITMDELLYVGTFDEIDLRKVEVEWLCRDSLLNKYPKLDYPTQYEEVYYHYSDPDDINSPIDWALVKCVCEASGFGCHFSYALVGDRMVYAHDELKPFELMYAVYDVEKDEFISIENVDVDAYEGLQEQIATKIKGSFPLGDANLDGDLTILDAATIQRGIARISNFEEIRAFFSGHDICLSEPRFCDTSDIDCDGKRSILDAAMIQRKLAFIEE